MGSECHSLNWNQTLMAKGFAPTVPSVTKECLTQPQQIQPIEEIQANLLNYVKEIQDPRSQRAQKHF